MNSLWCLINVGKGSRQIGSVTSEKGLALRAERDGLEKDVLESSWERCCLHFGAGSVVLDRNEC